MPVDGRRQMGFNSVFKGLNLVSWSKFAEFPSIENFCVTISYVPYNRYMYSLLYSNAPCKQSIRTLNIQSNRVQISPYFFVDCSCTVLRRVVVLTIFDCSLLRCSGWACWHYVTVQNTMWAALVSVNSVLSSRCLSDNEEALSLPSTECLNFITRQATPCPNKWPYSSFMQTVKWIKKLASSI